MQSFIEIIPLRKEISHHENTGVNEQRTDGRPDEQPENMLPSPLILLAEEAKVVFGLISSALLD